MIFIQCYYQCSAVLSVLNFKGAKVPFKKRHMLYILTRGWVLHTPNPGFQKFLC